MMLSLLHSALVPHSSVLLRRFRLLPKTRSSGSIQSGTFCLLRYQSQRHTRAFVSLEGAQQSAQRSFKTIKAKLGTYLERILNASRVTQIAKLFGWVRLG